MNGITLLSTYNTTTWPQWNLKWSLWGTTTSMSRYRYNHNVKSLSSSSSTPSPSSEAEAGVNGKLRRALLEQVDKELSKGDDRAALSLINDLQSKPGGLRCFGAAQQVPQRLYTINELKLNGIETASLLSPKDTTLGAIERNLQIAAFLGFISAWNVFDFDPEELVYVSLPIFFFWTLDLISAGRVTATMLNKFSCIALAGVATEYLLYGYAEGGLTDVNTDTFSCIKFLLLKTQ